ncbi:unnamed protein product [Amoebophrya sp. A120]|nr:unnamed protein product [Amoebophrya sp. A120]|eukprot:GSA120T00015928001.1
MPLAGRGPCVGTHVAEKKGPEAAVMLLPIKAVNWVLQNSKQIVRTLSGMADADMVAETTLRRIASMHKLLAAVGPGEMVDGIRNGHILRTAWGFFLNYGGEENIYWVPPEITPEDLSRMIVLRHRPGGAGADTYNFAPLRALGGNGRLPMGDPFVGLSNDLQAIINTAAPTRAPIDRFFHSLTTTLARALLGVVVLDGNHKWCYNLASRSGNAAGALGDNRALYIP